MRAETQSRLNDRSFAQSRRVVWISYALLLLSIATVSATSPWIKDGAVTGRLWPLLVDELTSVSVVLALTPGVGLVTSRLRPRRFGWYRCIVGHLAALVSFAVAHVTGMFLLRRAIYPVFGASYHGDGNVLLTVIYEGRKDILVYICLVIFIHRLVKFRPIGQPNPATTAPPPPEPPSRPDNGALNRIPYREGPLRSWIAAEKVLWVEAAGNYIEFVLSSRRILQRQPLRAIEPQLASLGFVRVHRSRLVNANHIRSVVTKSTGDFTLTLSDDQVICGSRRFRKSLPAEFVGVA